MQVKELRVLLVSSIYPPDIGGPAAQTQHIAHHLNEMGVPVEVVTFGTESNFDKGVMVHRIALPSSRTPLGRVNRYLKFFRQLAKIVRGFRPTIIQMQVACMIPA